ncbi:O-antigen ligase family protein [Deinococcus rubellus]|uniref:O-antigen ligase family protein n=1 Tax=Deinococcus rubellus TaxID=1889240 RepID=A0ABY5YH53_9DEIO|nr:O-antigen ligase family protein [Deinococcus rubellus]UWX63143.1 O-antigen ligase family protein [Deinococcus rubellus]
MSVPISAQVPFTPPRWLPWLIAAVPVLPFFYLAAFGALGSLRRLPRVARWVLFYFAASQVLAALLTPNPLLSLAFGGVRTLLILAMISAGVYLQDSRHLRPLLWGQLIIFVWAWSYTLLTQGVAGVEARLNHPYYYPVSLGLVAVVALWLVMFWRGGAAWWRILAGLVVVATLLAAGSRGPMLALTLGSVAALLLAGHRGSRRWVVVPLGVVAIIILVVSALQLKFAPILRLLDDQTSGRNFVWADAYAAWQTSALGGVGAYQGGPYLTSLFKDGCALLPTLIADTPVCSLLDGIWMTAHNAWLHWLLETGVMGLSGLLVVYAYGLWAAVKSRDPLLIAVLFGYTAMNFVDVVIAVPSPHFAELWWVALGISVWRAQGAAAEQTRPAEPATAELIPPASTG